MTQAQLDARGRRRAAACEECGVTFTPGNSLGRYCSSACRQRAWRKARPGYQSAATKRYLAASLERQERRRAYMDEYRTRPSVIARANERNRQRYLEDSTASRARSKESYESRMRFIRAVKTTCGCIDCGTRAGRLDFDHRPGTQKLFTIGSSVQRKFSVLIAEIEKCDVRCLVCHATRHERDKRAQKVGA